MLADSASDVSSLFNEASDALGYDLWQLVQEGPAEQLNQTEFTQPALLTASVALWRAAKAAGLPQPDAVAGHSLGEYSALVAAEVISFADGVRLVQQRGRFMQTAVPVGEGGMAAILGLDDEQVKEICTGIDSGVVQAANFNAPGQVVIAGANDALEAAITACKEAGAKRAMALAVSAPFHSELMKPAADEMAGVLADVAFNSPVIPVMQNVDASFCDEPSLIRDNLVTQMFSAVLWTETVQNLVSNGITDVVECGPGKVLAGLNRRIDRSVNSHSIGSSADAMGVAGELS